MYKLNAVKFTFRPRYQNYNINQGASATVTNGIDIPYVCILIDPEIELPITGTWNRTQLNTLLEQGGRIRRADRPFSVYLRPKVQEQFGLGAVRYLKSQWTSLGTAAGPNVPHRGFHMFWFNATWNNLALAQNSYDIDVTYYLQFKNPK